MVELDINDGNRLRTGYRMGNERNIVFNEEKTRKTRWTSFWLLAQEKRAELENSKNERAAGTQSSEARRIEEMEVRNEQTRGRSRESCRG